MRQGKEKNEMGLVRICRPVKRVGEGEGKSIAHLYACKAFSKSISLRL